MLNIAVTLPTLLLPEPIPDGDFLQPPEGTEAMSQHVLLVVLDGVPNVVFDDESIMPFMSQFENVGAKVDVQTSLMTLTGPCVKEMSTGRKAANIDALRNWGVKNDGKDDPFHYALDRGDSVAFTGFYVWSNLYTDSHFIHQTVELGALGGVASLALFASVFAIATHHLLLKRRTGHPVYRLLLFGLMAVILSRFFEMMFGVARVSDLTVLWVVFGLL